VTRIAIRRALIAVYDKTGLEELARGLEAAGVEIVSTGGTAAKIASFGVPVTKVESLTGFPTAYVGMLIVGLGLSAAAAARREAEAGGGRERDY